MTNKITSAVTAFLVAFSLATLINMATGNYWLQISYEESFTFSEAEALVGKRVVDSCFSDPKGVEGFVLERTDSIRRGTNYLTIEYDEAINGKFNLISSNKEMFEKCLKIIE